MNIKYFKVHGIDSEIQALKEKTLNKLFVISVLVVGFVFWTSAASSEPDVREGSWGITMITEVPGTVRGLPIRYTNCITKQNIVPQHTKSSCTISGVNKVGNTVSWTVNCEKENVVSAGRVTYAGTTFDGTLNTTTTDGEKKMERSMLKGQYLGPCN